MDEYTLLIFGGPMIALVAFVSSLVPQMRPLKLRWTLGLLGLAASLPVAVSFLMNSGYPLLYLRPGTVLLGAIAAISYFVVTRRCGRHSFAAIALLLASVWDGASLLIITAPGFGGEYC